MSLEKEIYWYRFEPNIVNNSDRFTRISKSETWVSDPKNFNDPMDLKIKLVVGPDWKVNTEIYKKFLEKMLEEKSCNIENPLLPLEADIQSALRSTNFPNELVIQIEQQIEKFGVQCFSRSIDSSLSWSHYSSAHRGFAIKYLAKEFNIAFQNIGTCHFDNVSYMTELPEICLSECVFAPHNTIKRILATKSSEWSYESEVRLIYYNSKNVYTALPNGLSLNGFIVGAFTSDEDEQLLAEKAKFLEVDLEYSIIKSGRIQLVDKRDWDDFRTRHAR